MKDILGRKGSNSLYKHNRLIHQDSDKKFERFQFQQVSSHPSVLQRLLTESYLIQSEPNLINSKNEYGASKWISITRSKQAT